MTAYGNRSAHWGRRPVHARGPDPTPVRYTDTRGRHDERVHRHTFKSARELPFGGSR